MTVALKSPALRVQTVPFAGAPDVPSSVQAFSVVRDGMFAGRMFRSGEVALVHGGPEEGDAVVLVAQGPGRPRLGRVQGNQLVGDRGEPCLMSRWEVAGRVIGVARPMGAVWVIEHFDGMTAEAVVDGRFTATLAEATPVQATQAVPIRQLDLFAA